MADPVFKATIPELIRARAAEAGDSTFFVYDHDKLTFAEADRRSRPLARRLLALGIGRGSRVGLLYPNNVDFVLAFLAVTRIGAAAIPYSTLATPAELAYQLANSDVEVLLGANGYRTKNFRKNLEDAFDDLDFRKPPPFMSRNAPSLRRIFLNEMPAKSAGWCRDSLIAAGEKVSDAFLRAAEDAVRPADRFVVVYTSGSTSAPKGVVHNHGALLEHLRHLNKIRGYTRDETLFSNAPFFWIGGLAYGLIGALEAHSRVVYSAATTAKDLLDTIEREKPTFVTGFAQSVAHVAKEPDYDTRDLSTVRRGNMPAIMAPDARPDDLELRHNKLGSTETGSVYLTHEYEGPLPESLRGSFGKPTPGFEVRITDPETGKGVAAGESGEIWIRGPYVMEGYLGKERHDTFTPDGWYRTGDLAHVDAEGHVFYKNRLGDMIKTSGANVSPREVEDALLDVTGQRSHVVGVADKERGQMVAAAIISDTYKGDENAIRDQLKSKISSYKIPRRILFLKEAEVPMLSSGKLDKRKLVEMFRAT